MKWHTKGNISPLKQKMTNMSLVIFEIYVVSYTTIFFKSFVHIVQNKVNFLKILKQHVRFKNV